MEVERAEAFRKLEDMGCVAKNELVNFTKHRVDGINKNLSDLASLQIKQSKVCCGDFPFYIPFLRLRLLC